MKRVLVLSKEEGLVEETEQMLAKRHHIEIKNYPDSLSVIENLLTLQCEMIILDIDLLKEQTARILHILRLINKQIPIVLILSQEHMPICLAVFSGGAISYLTKPIASKNFCDLIASTLKANHLKKHK